MARSRKVLLARSQMAGERCAADEGVGRRWSGNAPSAASVRSMCSAPVCGAHSSPASEMLAVLSVAHPARLSPEMLVCLLRHLLWHLTMLSCELSLL